MREELLKKIEKARDYMYDLIRKSGNLTNPEVVLASQMLDCELNTYNNLFN